MAPRMPITCPFGCAEILANLGGKPVDEVAAALTRRNVPFAFATGYAASAPPQLAHLARPSSGAAAARPRSSSRSPILSGLRGLSTPERHCIGGPEQKSITTASKKAPISGAFLLSRFNLEMWRPG